MSQEDEEEQGEGILTPHEHDVLSGRGNFVNYHAGNEHFRALVRKHKVAYVACPKAQKGKFSKLIVDEIKALDPPGRFLKQDPVTKLWTDIGEKKALDKTRQALREGAPEIMKELNDDDSAGDDQAPDSISSPHAIPRSPVRLPMNMVSPHSHATAAAQMAFQPGLVAGYASAPSGNPYIKSPGGMYEAAARMSQMHRIDPNGMGVSSQQLQAAANAPPSPYHLPQHVGNLGMMPVQQLQLLPPPIGSPVRQQVPQHSPYHPSSIMEQQIQDHLQQHMQMPPPPAMGQPNDGVQHSNISNSQSYLTNHQAMQVKMNAVKSPPPFLSCFDPRPMPPSPGVSPGQQQQDNSSESDDLSPLPVAAAAAVAVAPIKSAMKSPARAEIKREDSDRSLHADSIFSGLKIPAAASALGLSSHHARNSGSSNHLSAISGMSLSIGDMAGDGSVSVDAINSLDSAKSMHADPLSLRFNNSLRIGGQPSTKPKPKKPDGSTKYFGEDKGNHSELLGHMDMSVATLGTADFDVSGGMSFSNVFED